MALSIDPDIRHAETLPRERYAEAWHRREAVLGRTWHLVGDAADLAPESAAPVTLLPGALDEPLLLTRDGEGELRCLSNVCTHRGAVIADAPCRGATVRCPYHGRRFHLDGRLRSAPGFEDAEGFPSARDDLPAVPFERHGRFLFASAAPEHALEELFAPVRPWLDFFPLDALVRDEASCRHYDVAAPWPAWCDNYLEGLHIPYVHPALARALDVSGYEVHVHPLSSLQVGVAADGEVAFDLPPGHPDHGRRIGGYYLFAFPTTALNFYPWGLSINVIEPRGPEHTRIRYLTYVWRPELREVGAGAGLDRVEQEDDEVVERVARGLRSRFYRRGRYAPRHETAVHAFHRLLSGFLG